MHRALAPIEPRILLYPDSDGRPLGETGWHVDSTSTIYRLVKDHFAARPDVYVAANMFLYFEEGNPKANRSPDCMVSFGVRGNHERRSFKTWVEGVVPAFIIEFASPETYREDLGAKRDVYARLGVAEYFLFDPLGECLAPRFQGFRLAGGFYESLPADAEGGIASLVLDLYMVPEGHFLRLIDLATGRSLLTRSELSEEYEQTAAERDEERRAVELERRRAEAEHRRAEAERLRAEELAAEVDRLRALLEKKNQAD